MMHTMAVNRPEPDQPRFLRILRWFFRKQASPVRAMENALRLRRSMRIIVTGSVLILLPSMLLAYFGIASIQGEELAAMGDIEKQADGAATSYLSQAERAFGYFEGSVLDRLEAGRSPLEAASELHPNLLIALKLDRNLDVVAPFYRRSMNASEPIEYLFDPVVQRAISAERRGEDGAVVARLYGRASRSVGSDQVKARMRFDRSRALLGLGRIADARMVLEDTRQLFGDIRDPWGFRMDDLIELFLAEDRIGREPLAGADDLRTLIDRLMDQRWAIGEGGEGAVARRALSRLEPFADSEWVASTRARIDDRMRMQFWTEELLPELDSVLAGQVNLSVDKGKIRWVQGDRGLWALTWWDENLYAFALDRTTLVRDARTLARDVAAPGSAIQGRLVGPNERMPDAVLVRRSLVPWMVGWSMVVTPRDAVALARELQSQRNRRIGIIFLAVTLIGVGALSTARFVRSELESARMKADFAANVSHELRSPITQIRLKAESLMLGLSDTVEEQQHDYRAIVRESERLSRLVDNVLDFSAIERGAKTYALVPGDIGESVRAAIDVVEGSAELMERDVYVSIQPSLPVVAHDPDAIAQCVINLTSNAAKYSEADRPIRVAVVRASGGVQISVTDEGIGIPEADLQQIFDPFFRGGDASVRRRKGTGIGLAITFYIVSAHNGRVDVVSKLGEGSAFSLWFPVLAGNPMNRQGA
ncbi:MAG: HAMP domain-containing sensor histidine kinase [Myxococcota bacterium]|nr:HAMP domain-containing sensor histidine kinase [Myxococcota bacterium]MEC9388935.1 HAMP domain-containing sensor histidine kinase [Myxococcota bacterium]